MLRWDRCGHPYMSLQESISRWASFCLGTFIHVGIAQFLTDEIFLGRRKCKMTLVKVAGVSGVLLLEVLDVGGRHDDIK